VSDKVKRKIRRGEYFSIDKLLQKNEEEEEEGAARRPKGPMSYFDWSRAYRVLMSLRLQHCPADLQGMLRHGEIVQNMYGQGKDGGKYDSEFRLTKAQHPHIKWGEYLAEVVDQLSVPQLRRNFSASKMEGRPETFRPPHRDMGRPVAFRPPLPQEHLSCNAYNSLAGCNHGACRFAHRCKLCGKEGHPAYRCYSRWER
jgi:hypothetical protein